MSVEVFEINKEAVLKLFNEHRTIDWNGFTISEARKQELADVLTTLRDHGYLRERRDPPTYEFTITDKGVAEYQAMMGTNGDLN